jgi:hypothetical protein
VYNCSCCRKEYKRLPVEVIAYADCTFLLCRFCKDALLEERDRLFRIGRRNINRLKEYFPVPVREERYRLSSSTHNEWIYYDSQIYYAMNDEQLSFPERAGDVHLL